MPTATSVTMTKMIGLPWRSVQCPASLMHAPGLRHLHLRAVLQPESARSQSRDRPAITPLRICTLSPFATPICTLVRCATESVPTTITEDPPSELGRQQRQPRNHDRIGNRARIDRRRAPSRRAAAARRDSASAPKPPPSCCCGSTAGLTTVTLPRTSSDCRSPQLSQVGPTRTYAACACGIPGRARSTREISIDRHQRRSCRFAISPAIHRPFRDDTRHRTAHFRIRKLRLRCL